MTFAFIVGFIAFFLSDNNEILNKMAKKPSPIPAWMSLSSGISVVIFLLYFEKWLMGGAYLFSLVMFMELNEKVSEIKTKIQKSDSTGEKLKTF